MSSYNVFSGVTSVGLAETSIGFICYSDLKGKDVTQRLQEQLADPCYDTLREYDPNFGAKIVGIEGDTSELGLALSETKRKVLLNEVDIIFHGAATVRFDDHIKKAVLTNARGTREANDTRWCRRRVTCPMGDYLRDRLGIGVTRYRHGLGSFYLPGAEEAGWSRGAMV
ncbi:Fatty acyl-CoA reductase wat [Eumeta japonica]|uniref:Fatty acyl-CoA reductase n=1 Tax=Eumeta variegata TaxID=151549 RepID=A0A4C1XR76_EUMVA|nr:Fatty acyl-CoA reductase wat [Eumeta japonica]